MQRYIDFVSRGINLNDKTIKWTDLQVASWRREEIRSCWNTQKDGYMPIMSPLISIYWFSVISHDLPFLYRYSCGLYMLNFMEYWSGDVLSDDVTQV
jgi:hypothetical protein